MQGFLYVIVLTTRRQEPLAINSILFWNLYILVKTPLAQNLLKPFLHPGKNPFSKLMPLSEFFALALFLGGGCGGALMVFSLIIPLNALILGNLGFVAYAPYLICPCV